MKPKRKSAKVKGRGEPDKRVSPKNALSNLIHRAGIEEIARRLGATQRTLRRWITDGIPEFRKSEVKASWGRSERSRKAALTRAQARADERAEREAIQAEAGEKPSSRGDRRKRERSQKRFIKISETLSNLAIDRQELKKTRDQMIRTRQSIISITKQLQELEARMVRLTDEQRKVRDRIEATKETLQERVNRAKNIDKEVNDIAKEFGVTDLRGIYTLFFSPPSYGTPVAA